MQIEIGIVKGVALLQEIAIMERRVLKIALRYLHIFPGPGLQVIKPYIGIKYCAACAYARMQNSTSLPQTMKSSLKRPIRSTVALETARQAPVEARTLRVITAK